MPDRTPDRMPDIMPDNVSSQSRAYLSHHQALKPTRHTVSRSVAQWIALNALVTIAALCLSSSSWGYYSTIDTGEVIAPDHYQVSLEPQAIFNRYPGTNLVGRVDTGLNESSSLRGILGFGVVNFQVGGMYKYVPFPDLERQPAIGGEVGAILAQVNGQTEFSVRFHPLVSKRLETEVGDVTPYAALPLGITTRPDKTYMPMQIASGAEFRPLNHPSWSVFGEVGININESFSYASVALAWRFDELGSTKRKVNRKN